MPSFNKVKTKQTQK